MLGTMRILHAESRDGGHGGQTIRLAQEAVALNERSDIECSVVGQRGGPLDESLAGVPWYVPFDFHSFRLHPAVLWRALAVIRSIRPDVVHTHSSRDAWTFGLAAKTLGLPVVRGRHVTRGIRSHGYRNVVYTRLADAFTVSGRTVGRILIDGGVAREEQVFVTPGGFDPIRFDAAKRDTEFLRTELGLTPETRIIGGAANLRASKGVDVLVEAFRTLRAASTEPVALVLAGHASREDRNELSRDLDGEIHFLGFRHDIESVIGGFDVFVMASRRWDGIPQVIPQAMALRVPVIGTEAGGIPDIVEPGVTGHLVPPDDARTMAAVILEVLDKAPSERKPLLDAAESRAQTDYTTEGVVDTYLEAYRYVTR